MRPKLLSAPPIAALSALLLLSSACSAPAPDADATTTPATNSPEETELDLAARVQPPRPEPTETELEALVASPEIESLNSPFANGPAPDRSIHVTMSDGT